MFGLFKKKKAPSPTGLVCVARVETRTIRDDGEYKNIHTYTVWNLFENDRGERRYTRNFYGPTPYIVNGEPVLSPQTHNTHTMVQMWVKGDCEIEDVSKFQANVIEYNKLTVESEEGNVVTLAFPKNEG